MTEYVLKIEAPKEMFSEITNLLGIEPSQSKYSWEFSIKEDDNLYNHAIEHLVSIIKGKKTQLERIGINSSDISVWFYKPYSGQCNMEFTPVEMKELSNNNITLCISCWEEND